MSKTMEPTDYQKNLTEICIPQLKENRNWDFVFKFIQKSLSRKEEYAYTIRFLLDCLNNYSCNDFTVVRRIIETYSRQLSSSMYVAPIEQHARMEYLMRPLFRFNINEVSGMDIMLGAIEEPDVKLAEAAAKYSYSFCVPPCAGPTNHCSYFRIYKTLLEFSSAHYFPSDLFADPRNDVSEVVSVLSSEDGKMLSENRRGFQRIYLISLILKALMKKMEMFFDRSPECFDCLRFFFRTHAEPYVTKEELEEFLHFFFKNKENDFVQKMVNMFVEMFQPESLAVYCPRSLKDLCRYTIRRTVRYCKDDDIILPNAIESLSIPPCLKDFLLGMS